MKKLLIITAICLAGSEGIAECYADYKAKQDNPLRLHYGVALLDGTCTIGAASDEMRQRLQRSGWSLLTVISVFGPEGLEERKASAGDHYLRF